MSVTMKSKEEKDYHITKDKKYPEEEFLDDKYIIDQRHFQNTKAYDT